MVLFTCVFIILCASICVSECMCKSLCALFFHVFVCIYWRMYITMCIFQLNYIRRYGYVYVSMFHFLCIKLLCIDLSVEISLKPFVFSCVCVTSNSYLLVWTYLSVRILVRRIYLHSECVLLSIIYINLFFCASDICFYWCAFYVFIDVFILMCMYLTPYFDTYIFLWLLLCVFYV